MRQCNQSIKQRSLFRNRILLTKNGSVVLFCLSISINSLVSRHPYRSAGSCASCLIQCARARRPRCQPAPAALPVRVMNLFTQPRVTVDAALQAIEIVEPAPENCPAVALPPEGNVKIRNYRMLNENICTYSPTGDINTSPDKGKLVSKYDVYSTLSPPRQKILELLRPEDPGRDALEAIVRPAPRRGLARPFDEDTRRFLQRALLSPSPQISNTCTPEPRLSEATDRDQKSNEQQSIKSERSLADELKEAEEEEKAGGIRRDLLREFRKREGGTKEAMERERMGKLALSVEEDEEEDCGLSGAARRLDALLAESRSLHEELAGIHEDMQVLARRTARRDL
ncbi:hypothetical protein RR46_03615 [Papilio xuthus]|uniref:Uncharacterized protein n=1 Tax=Papilio xuthus TaxID=66420 RepID=A0A194PZJ8_PAPXU|nr:hypothetical protein RR46_03615 [Papilio xuthus]